MTQISVQAPYSPRIRTLHTWLFAGFLQVLYYSPIGDLLFFGQYPGLSSIAPKAFELVWIGVIFVAFVGLVALRGQLFPMISELGEQLGGRSARWLFLWSAKSFVYLGTVFASLGLFAMLVNDPVMILLNEGSRISFLSLMVAAIYVIASAGPILLLLKRSHAVAQELFHIESR